MTVSRAFASTFGALALLVLVSETLVLQHLAADREAVRRVQTHQLVGDSVARSVRAAGDPGGQLERSVMRSSQSAGIQMRWVWLDARSTSDGPRVRTVERTQFSAVTMEVDGRRALVSYTPTQTSNGLGAVELTEPLPPAGGLPVTTLVLVNAAVLLGLFALAGWLLGVRLVGRPIAALTDLARRVGAGDLTATAELHTGTELDGLGAALTGMARSLEQRVRERDAAVEQARHADRLASVGKLAAGVAHELGTPLNVVRGRARMLQGDEVDTDVAARAAEEIIGETDRMSDLVRQLLDFAGKRGAGRTRLDVRDVVEHALALLEPTARKRGIQFRADLASAPVLANAAQLQQVVTNLAINAIHASPNGGVVEVGLALADHEVKLEVRDHGPGLSAEAREHLFEPFFTTKPPGEGTGLGLAVSFGIVQELGGRIEASNAANGGARFEVALPGAEAAP